MKKKFTAAWIILALFIIFSAVSGYILFFTEGGAQTIASGTRSFGAFDLRVSYTPDNIMTVLSAYEGDRQAAFFRYFIYDFIFMFCCAVTMLTITIMINMTNTKHYIFYRLGVFSASFYTIFNAAENMLLMRIINSFPVFTDSDANLSSGCTTMKWIFLGLWAFGTLMFGILTAITQAKQKNRIRQTEED